MKEKNIKKLEKAGLHNSAGVGGYLFGNPHGGRDGPCYVTFCGVDKEVNTKKKAHVLIEVAADENEKGILVLSVTERDGVACYKAVKEAAMEYEGATITESVSRWHGNYKVWMISIPLH